ncbi:hypothetical protein EVC27_097 [Rhizobium phage RHph_I1_6]|uniref:Uncharacterized protein n=1 Tax=Rhizobium phage RHph_I1_6 TaxID=2509728 RepID=A0A7S5RNT1_9CAUD|nr:hypothetical protein PP745_gp094 [Rhizobium phage RHph_I1_6]QIG76619.1 hypothetical protein EVC27_097 [Rhizobium phage RHph_I1_6]
MASARSDTKALRSLEHAQQVEAALQFCSRHKVGRPLVPAHILQTLVVELLYRKNIIHDLMTQVYPHQESIFAESNSNSGQDQERSICNQQSEVPSTTS